MISFRPDPEQFRTIAVYGDSLVLIVSPAHPLAGAGRVSINDLGKENFIAHNVASPLRRKVIETFQRYRTPLNMGIELPTIEAIKRFVAMGNGVALVPHLTVARELETGELVRGNGDRTGDEAGTAPGASPSGSALLCRHRLPANGARRWHSGTGRRSTTTWRRPDEGTEWYRSGRLTQQAEQRRRTRSQEAICAIHESTVHDSACV